MSTAAMPAPPPSNHHSKQPVESLVRQNSEHVSPSTRNLGKKVSTAKTLKERVVAHKRWPEETEGIEGDEGMKGRNKACNPIPARQTPCPLFPEAMPQLSSHLVALVVAGASLNGATRCEWPAKRWPLQWRVDVIIDACQPCPGVLLARVVVSSITTILSLPFKEYTVRSTQSSSVHRWFVGVEFRRPRHWSVDMHLLSRLAFSLPDDWLCAALAFEKRVISERDITTFDPRPLLSLIVVIVFSRLRLSPIS